METAERRVRWFHYNVEPFLVACFLACSAELNAVTAQLFVWSFMLALGSFLSFFSLLIYRRGLFRLAWQHLEAAGRWLWSQLMALREFYWAKVVVGLGLAFLGASSVLWLCLHLDLPRLLSDTLLFLGDVLRALLDPLRLTQAIQLWLKQVALAPLARLFGAIWSSARRLIERDGGLGLALIAAGSLGLCWFLYAARAFRAWFWGALPWDLETSCDGCGWLRFFFLAGP